MIWLTSTRRNVIGPTQLGRRRWRSSTTNSPGSSAQVRGCAHGRRSDPKGGGGGLYGPQNCCTEQCALSAPEAPQILFQAYGRGNFFCLTLCVCTQNTQNFVENSKMAEKHKKGYVATLPTCGPLLILPPALKRRGSPRRQGLCSHLAHKRATSDSAPRSQAEGIPQAAGVM